MWINEWRLWALASAAFAGVTAILAKIGVAGVNSNLATAIRTGVVLLFSWTLVWATDQTRDISAINIRTWVFLTLSGLATGLSWICYFRALQLGEASRVAPIDKLSVIFAIVLAAVFLGERLTWHQWLGGGLILAGAIIIAAKLG